MRLISGLELGRMKNTKNTMILCGFAVLWIADVVAIRMQFLNVWESLIALTLASLCSVFVLKGLLVYAPKGKTK